MAMFVCVLPVGQNVQIRQIYLILCTKGENVGVWSLINDQFT